MHAASAIVTAALVLTSPAGQNAPAAPTEIMIRGCLDGIRKERELFEAELAEYRTVFTNNPPDSVAVRSAVRRIVERGPVAVPFLIDLLRSPGSNESANARDALIRLQESDALGATTDEVYEAAIALVREQAGLSPRTRSNAASVLFRLRGPRLEKDLLRLLAAESDRPILLGIVRTLGELRAASATKPLESLLSDDRFEVRAEAARALGRVGAPGVAARLLPMLDDESYEVRRAAYDALGSIRDPGTLEALHRKLADLVAKAAGTGKGDDVPERREALWAIGAVTEIGHPVSLAPLKEILLLSDWDLARRARESIREILEGIRSSGDDRGALGPIVALLDVDDVTVVSSALEAIVALGDRGAVPALIRLLNSPNSSLAGYAADALGEVATPDDRPAVEALRRRFKRVEGRKRGRNTRLMERLAFALAKLGQPSHLRVILEPYRAKIKKDPRDIDSMVRLGEIYLDVRDYRNARYQYRKALGVATDRKDRSRLTYKIGVCYALEEDFDRADAKMEEARRLGFRFDKDLFEKGDLQALRKSESQQVRDYYRKLRRQSGLGTPAPARQGSSPRSGG